MLASQAGMDFDLTKPTLAVAKYSQTYITANLPRYAVLLSHLFSMKNRPAGVQ